MELRVDPSRRVPATLFEGDRETHRGLPFFADGAPVEIMTEGRRLPDWKLVEGSAGPLPVSPVSSRSPSNTQLDPLRLRKAAHQPADAAHRHHRDPARHPDLEHPFFGSAASAVHALMYVGGGKLIDVLGARNQLSLP